MRLIPCSAGHTDTNATQASQTITFTTSAPASAAYGTNFTVVALWRESGNSPGLSSQCWIVQQLGRDLHHDERCGDVFGDLRIRRAMRTTRRRRR